MIDEWMVMIQAATQGGEVEWGWTRDWRLSFLPTAQSHTRTAAHHCTTQLGIASLQQRQAGMPARAPPAAEEEVEVEEQQQQQLDVSRVLVTQRDGEDYQLRVYIPNSSSRETLRAIVKVRISLSCPMRTLAQARPD